MPKFSIKMFLPAAGLGERLRPITYHIPKPLLPVLGKTLIEIIMEKFSAMSSGRTGINLHYKPEMIKEWIKGSAFAGRVEIFPENPILGTGGALKNAEAFLSDNHFLVHNADILSDIDLTRLIETHLLSGNIATLAAHDYPKFNNVVIDDKEYVIDVGNIETPMPNPEKIAKKVAFTGIAVYSTEILRFLPSGVSHVTTAWMAAAKAGHKVQAVDFTGCYWTDIGSPAAYASAIINALRNEGETVYIHPETEGCGDAEMDGYVVIEKGCGLTKGVSLRNCIAIPGAKLKNDSAYENCILGPDFKINLNEAEVLGSDKDEILIGTGGSDRKYYRVKKGNGTAVVMKCAAGDSDYHRHIEHTKFFSRHNIPVPELIEEKPDNLEATFEDLGDISLYSWLRCRREPKQVEDMYRNVLDIAVKLHTETTVHVPECPMLRNRIFDYGHYRWETGYFIERFVAAVKKIEVKNLSALQDEFHMLAQKAGSFPKALIHRDFQAQNIMIHKGIPRLIDYQGARMGLPAYDVASILWDPYYRLQDDMRERLLEYYIGQAIPTRSSLLTTSAHPSLEKRRLGDFRINEKDFKETLLLCRLQRHMQALGAYGFLSSIKGKKYFLKHIPEGVRLLKEDVVIMKDGYPELYGLVMGL